MALQTNENTEKVLADWAAGRITLKEVLGCTNEELLALAHMGYFFLMQGKNQEAKTLFEGLLAIDPRNDYYYRALGVIFHKLGDGERAIRQFTYAIELNPESPYAYVNRAELYLSFFQYKQAEEDLRRGLTNVGPKDQELSRKAHALLQVVLAK